ncbi:TetR/AcrR family transcriptional regulator [Streptomyces sp. NPDC005438]|uniref:TetR/AcrR family transcriptional regulator n=1 Tax=Streptomyces sp. NPDC005438 TaxID=3156880 RepID=UPI0033AA9758
MSPAREALLRAAREAVRDRPWASVRMVEVAVRAGVSRQTLYNEFGDKRGLGTAVVEGDLDAFLRGTEQVLASGTDLARTWEEAARWMVAAAEDNPLIRGALTGAWSEPVPLSRTPAALLEELRRRAVGVLGDRTGVGRPELDALCDAALRLTLSYVLIPAPRTGAPLLGALDGPLREAGRH